MSLVETVSPELADIVVVDNDESQSARSLVASYSERVQYVHQPNPGIAAARNKALEVGCGYELIAFLDDDEFVERGWFDALHTCLHQSGVDVVTGPVVTRLGGQAPSWVERGEFLQRKRFPTGTDMASAATNNVLVRTAAIMALADPYFDVAFGRSGGSDTELFWRLTRAGSKIVWCDEAVVVEDAPAERPTLRWIAKRLVRAGNVEGRLRRREASAVQVLAFGVSRVGIGTIQVLWSLILGRGLRYDDLRRLLAGTGIARAAFNSTVYEYTRG